MKNITLFNKSFLNKNKNLPKNTNSNPKPKPTFESNIEKFKSSHKYYFYNIYNLGDHVFNFILFYMIKSYIETNKIFIYYYCKNEYLEQIREFICSKNIFLLPISEKPDLAIDLWINTNNYNYTHTSYINFFKDKNQKLSDFRIFYINFFNKVLRKIGFNIKINKLLYNDINLIQRYNELHPKYKNIDILIINSIPLSNQYNFDVEQWDTYIINLNTYFKIVTTKKVDNVLSTLDDKLSIKNIAALSTNVKVIIAINTGVFPGLLNSYTLQNVRKVYIFDNRCYYSYPNFENKANITDITIQEIQKYIL
jgi:hypothetical protein